MDYPSNSHKVKENENTKTVKPAELTGGVKIKKRSGFQKFVGTFIAEDANNVKDYLVNDVLIPNAKAAISEIVSNGINMILYGDAAPRRNSSSSTHVQRVQYGGYVNNNKPDTRKRAGSIKNDFDFDNLIFDSRGDAEIVLNNLLDALDRYETVTVAGLYDAAGIDTYNYMLNKYGWDDLSSAKINRTADGYILALPTPKLMD